MRNRQERRKSMTIDMMLNSNNDEEYESLKGGGNYNYGNSPTGVRSRRVVGSISISIGGNSIGSAGSNLTRGSTSGGKKGVSKRGWSPHQAALNRRKNKHGGDQDRLSDSFGQLELAAAAGGGEDDYLARSLGSIHNTPTASPKKGSPRPKYAGRRPMPLPLSPGFKSTSKSKSKSTSKPTTTTDAATKTTTTTTKPTLRRSKSNFGEPRQPLVPSTSTARTVIASKDNRVVLATTTRKSGIPSNKPIKIKPTAAACLTTTASKRNNNNNNKNGTNNDVDLLDEIPIEIRHKLFRITDPSISIREKVQLELELRNEGTPEQKELYQTYKTRFDRQQFMEWRAFEDHNKHEKIEADAALEQTKEKVFQKTLDRKRRQERKLKKEQKAKDRKLKDDARRYTAQTVANTMNEIKEAALEAATVSVERNKRETKAREDAELKRIEDFRNSSEGKTMSGGQRALKEALMSQKDPYEIKMRKEARRLERYVSSSANR